MPEEDIKKYYSFFCDVWKYFKKYAEKEVYEGFWKDVMDEGEALRMKYDNTYFVQKITIEVLFELERRKGKK